MNNSSLAQGSTRASVREENGLLIISPAQTTPKRRILFINVSRGRVAWRNYADGLMPSNRLWGCVELVALGYEVAIADALPDFYLHRNPFPHDLRWLSVCRNWLRPEDIVYCAHNRMYWLPFARLVKLLRCRVVSLLYAREPLNLARAHDGVIALNPAAAGHARKLAPKAKVAHLSWGMDLSFLPRIPFQAGRFLACGRTNRDFLTLQRAARRTAEKIRLIGHGEAAKLKWPGNVDRVPGGSGFEERLPYAELLNNYYADATASLVILKPDPVQYTACGFTNLLEAMAMERPVIFTRTNAVQTELDIEASQCGLLVPPQDDVALATALDVLAKEPERAREMGKAGRRLCEQHYNMQRFGRDLDRFFDSL